MIAQQFGTQSEAEYHTSLKLQREVIRLKVIVLEFDKDNSIKTLTLVIIKDPVEQLTSGKGQKVSETHQAEPLEMFGYF